MDKVIDWADHLLPQWHFSERHALLVEGASAAHAYDCILPGLSAEDPLIGKAIALRELPGRLLRSIGLSSNTLPARPFGFHSFTLLGQTPGREVAFGLAGHFWKLDYGLRPIGDVTTFTSMTDQPRLLLNVCVEPVGEQGCRLVTHTRVHCPTEEQRRRFAPYWYAIRPVSGLIRRRLLRRIARLAGGGLP
ncbi:MAG: hypothetical protein KDF54_05080 [Hydrogenophaga sp.]|nr:hypothetical protein [Hydrogenophaga sp.]